MPMAIYPILTIFFSWVGSCWRKAFSQAVFCGYFPLGLEHKMNYMLFFIL
jgi:hypothetical protein